MRVVQTSKLIDKINFEEAIDFEKGLKKSFSFDLELENKDINNESIIIINKVMKNNFKYIK